MAEICICIFVHSAWWRWAKKCRVSFFADTFRTKNTNWVVPMWWAFTYNLRVNNRRISRFMIWCEIFIRVKGSRSVFFFEETLFVWKLGFSRNTVILFMKRFCVCKCSGFVIVHIEASICDWLVNIIRKRFAKACWECSVLTLNSYRWWVETGKNCLWRDDFPLVCRVSRVCRVLVECLHSTILLMLFVNIDPCNTSQRKG